MTKAFVMNNGHLQAVNLKDLDKSIQLSQSDPLPADPYIVLRSGERVRSSELSSRKDMKP